MLLVFLQSLTQAAPPGVKPWRGTHTFEQGVGHRQKGLAKVPQIAPFRIRESSVGHVSYKRIHVCVGADDLEI